MQSPGKLTNLRSSVVLPPKSDKKQATLQNFYNQSITPSLGPPPGSIASIYGSSHKQLP